LTASELFDQIRRVRDLGAPTRAALDWIIEAGKGGKTPKELADWLIGLGSSFAPDMDNMARHRDAAVAILGKLHTRGLVRRNGWGKWAATKLARRLCSQIDPSGRRIPRSGRTAARKAAPRKSPQRTPTAKENQRLDDQIREYLMFRPDDGVSPEELAEKFGLSQIDLDAAHRRLTKLDVLEIRDGRWFLV